MYICMYVCVCTTPNNNVLHGVPECMYCTSLEYEYRYSIPVWYSTLLALRFGFGWFEDREESECGERCNPDHNTSIDLDGVDVGRYQISKHTSEDRPAEHSDVASSSKKCQCLGPIRVICDVSDVGCRRDTAHTWLGTTQRQF